jgi:hypothetical protein
MLTIQGEKQRFCDGVSRRNFLKIGGLALGGWSLLDVLRAEAATGTRLGHKAVIMIYLPGGPPHQDMFDLKPDAPAEIRGEYKPIKTNVSGIEICEHMPRLAGMMDKFAIIRSLVGARDEHTSQLCMTGYNASERNANHAPSLGAVLSHLKGPVDRTVPPFVGLIPKTGHAPYSNPGDPGFLGLAHSPLQPDGQVMQDMVLKDVSLDRLSNRKRVLASMDRFRRETDASVEGMDALHQRVFDILTSRKLVEALNVEREDPKLREKYGRGATTPFADGAPCWNDQFLVARRLVEAGARCVTLGFGCWDFHQGDFGFGKSKVQIAKLDVAVSALVQDLHDRGLDKDVSVVVWGEFGRTPKLNNTGGRDHWPHVSCCLLAGGGMRTGQVIGSTNKFAEVPDERPVHYRDVFVTLYHNLGIDIRNTAVTDEIGRPHYLLAEHEPVSELI